MEGDQGVTTIIEGSKNGLMVAVLPNRCQAIEKQRYSNSARSFSEFKRSNIQTSTHYPSVNNVINHIAPDISYITIEMAQQSNIPLNFPMLEPRRCMTEMSNDTKYFAATLRKYPLSRSPTKSTDLIQDILKHGHSNTKKKCSSGKRSLRITTSQQTYRTKNWFEGSSNDSRRLGNVRERLRSPASAEENGKNDFINCIYDYMDNESQLHSPDVRYLTGVKRACYKFKNIMCPKPQVCPYIKTRYDHHKKHHHDKLSQKASPCPCKKIKDSSPVQTSPTICIPPPKSDTEINRRSSRLHNNPLRCSCKKNKNNFDFKDKQLTINAKELHEKIKKWTDFHTTTYNTPSDETKINKLVNKLSDALSYMLTQKNGVTKARNEIIKFLKALTLIQPNIKDKLHHLAENLLQNLIYENNIGEEKESKLINDLPLNSIDVNNANQAVNDFIRNITSGSDKDYNKLKSCIIDFLSKLPLNYDGKYETLNNIADKFLSNLIVLDQSKDDKDKKSRKDICSEYKSNKCLNKVISWFRDIPELGSHIHENMKYLNTLSNHLSKMFGSKDILDDQETANQEILSWLQNVLTLNNVSFSKSVQVTLATELISKLQSIPRKPHDSFYKQDSICDEIYNTCFKDIDKELSTHTDVKKQIYDLINKFNSICDENTESKTVLECKKELENWFDFLAGNFNIYVNDKVKKELECKIVSHITDLLQKKQQISEVNRIIENEIINLLRDTNMTQEELQIILDNIKLQVMKFTPNEKDVLENIDLVLRANLNLSPAKKDKLVENILYKIEEILKIPCDSLNISDIQKRKTRPEINITSDESKSRQESQINNKISTPASAFENQRKYWKKNGKIIKSHAYGIKENPVVPHVNDLDGKTFENNNIKIFKPNLTMDSQNYDDYNSRNDETSFSINASSPRRTDTNTKNNNIITSTPNHSRVENIPDISNMTSFIVNNDDTVKAAIHKDDLYQLESRIKEWFDRYQIKLNEDDKRNIISSIASEITLRQNYIQASSKLPSDSEELEYLKYLIYKILNDLVQQDKIVDIMSEVSKLHETINRSVGPKLTSDIILENTNNDDYGSSSKNNILDLPTDYQNNSNEEKQTLSCDMEKFVQEFINVILCYVSLKNNRTVQQYMQYHVLKLLQIIPKLAKEHANKFFKEQLLDFLTIMKDSLQKDLQKNKKIETSIRNEDAIHSLLYSIIKDWCENLPISDDGAAEMKKYYTKYLTNKIFEKIFESNKKISILDDNDFLKNIFTDDIQLIIDNIPMSTEHRPDLPYYKNKLIDQLKFNKEHIYEEMTNMLYKRNLMGKLDTLSKNISMTPNDENSSIDIQTSFETIKNNLADAFINLNSYAAEEALKNIYKRQLKHAIDKFCDFYLRRYTGSPLDAKQLHSNIYNALDNVSKPSQSKFELELKTEINKLFNEITQSINLTKNEKDDLISVLAKRLYNLNKNYKLSFFNMHDELRKTILQWLQGISFKQGTPINSQYWVDRLIDNLKILNSFETSMAPSVSMYTIPAADTSNVNKKIDRPYDENIQEENLNRTTGSTYEVTSSPLVTDTLPAEDKNLLERVRKRTIKAATVQKSSSNTIPNVTRSFNSTTQIDVRSDRFEPASYTNKKNVEKPTTQEIISPKINVRQYFWDSNDTSQSSQLFADPIAKSYLKQPPRRIDVSSNQLKPKTIGSDDNSLRHKVPKSDNAKNTGVDDESLKYQSSTKNDKHVREKGLNQEMSQSYSDRENFWSPNQRKSKTLPPYQTNKTALEQGKRMTHRLSDALANTNFEAKKYFNHRLRRSSDHKSETSRTTEHFVQPTNFINKKHVDNQEDKGISEKVRAPEYLWNSNEPEQSSPIISPPNPPNISALEQALDKIVNRSSKSRTFNNGSATSYNYIMDKIDAGTQTDEKIENDELLSSLDSQTQDLESSKTKALEDRSKQNKVNFQSDIPNRSMELPPLLIAKRNDKLPHKFLLIPENIVHNKQNKVCRCRDRMLTKCRASVETSKSYDFKNCPQCLGVPCPFPSCLYFKRDF